MPYETSVLNKRRKIKTLDIPTPLLVPSFSSKGFPDLLGIWNFMKSYLPSGILISTYDLYYNHIKFDQVSDIIFLDSGGYEASAASDLSYIDQPVYDFNDWDKEKYLNSLRKIDDLSTCIVVSYDNPNMSVNAQIDSAQNDFSEFKNSSSDFLLKPSTGHLIDLKDLKKNLPRLTQFDILGITEKELGNTIVERLKNLSQIRMMLTEQGSEIPIHVFGCLDPMSIWFFYLSGADIFDGLSWLRYSFLKDITLYRNSWAIITGRMEMSDQDILFDSYLNNLGMLNESQRNMAQFTHNLSPSYIPFEKNLVVQLLALANISFTAKEQK